MGAVIGAAVLAVVMLWMLWFAPACCCRRGCVAVWWRPQRLDLMFTLRHYIPSGHSPVKMVRGADDLGEGRE